MQTSPSISLLSLSLSPPVNVNSQDQEIDDDHSPVGGRHLPAPPPALKPPARSAKRRTSTVAKAQKTAQTTKQELRSKIREDWTWPPSPNMTLFQDELNLPADESAWQERGEGFETEYSPGEPVIGDPYQFESPDAVTTSATATATRSGESRKRKRRQVHLEEMGWNQGLRCFVERRNVWSGAKECQLRSPIAARSGFGTKGSSRLDGDCDGDLDGERDILIKGNVDHASPDVLKECRVESIERPFERPSLQSLSEQSPVVTIVPFAPPILSPGNAVRASISPATYHSIYSKVVIQGLTPTITINLNDIVGSLVKGWKDNDEWPPKSDGERAALVEGAHGLEGLRESMSNGVKRGVRSKIGKVKRALHLSGTIEGDDIEQGSIRVEGAPDDIG